MGGMGGMAWHGMTWCGVGLRYAGLRYAFHAVLSVVTATISKSRRFIGYAAIQPARVATRSCCEIKSPAGRVCHAMAFAA